MRWFDDNRDFQNYSSFELMESTVAPDLLIYLRSSIPNLVDKYIKEDANMKTLFLLST
jgi:hypothetical protein